MKTSTASLCSSNVVRFKLLVLNRHSPCSVEPVEVGGALHYCHGAQAPWVIKNKMIGLAIKLNRKQKMIFLFFWKSVQNPSLKWDCRKVYLYVYLLVLTWTETKEAVIQNPQRRDAGNSFQPGNHIKTEQDFIPQMPVVRLNCRISLGGTHKSQAGRAAVICVGVS